MYTPNALQSTRDLPHEPFLPCCNATLGTREHEHVALHARLDPFIQTPFHTDRAGLRCVTGNTGSVRPAHAHVSDSLGTCGRVPTHARLHTVHVRDQDTTSQQTWGRGYSLKANFLEALSPEHATRSGPYLQYAGKFALRGAGGSTCQALGATGCRHGEEH